MRALGVRDGIVCFAACLVLAGWRPASAQLAGVPLAPLETGRLVVWVVEPSTEAPAPSRYRQQTAASFGQSASDFGTPAASVGVSPSSPLISRVGPVADSVAPGDRDAAVAAAKGYREQTAGSFGQSAGSAGTAAGDYGRTASTCGQSASNYGQSAGSYGVSLSNLHPPQLRPAKTPRWQPYIAPKVKTDYPRLQIQYVELTADKFDEALRTTVAGSTVYPDVVVFDGIPASWLPPGVNGCNAQRVQADESKGLPARRYLALNGSPHAETARAFLEYLDEMNHPK